MIIGLSSIVVIGLIMYLLNLQLSRIISGTCQQLEDLANGKLNYQNNDPSRIHEIKVLNDSMRRLQNYVSTLIEKITTESETLDQLGKHLNNSSEALTEIVTKQQHSTEHASVQIQQLSCSYEEVAENAVKTSMAT